jgi:transposase
MGNIRGFKRDTECFKTLEQRRLKAARLLEQGVHQSAVARRVGVHRQSVSRWARQLEEAGRAGLKRAGRAGRKPKLSDADLKRIEQGLQQGPEALGYSTSLWTSQRVAHLIKQECGVQYSLTHVWRLLKQLGWSCQRPVGRALERDEEAIRRWKKRRLPELKKTPRATTKPSSSSTKAG